jgi:hypothetical protein
LRAGAARPPLPLRVCEPAAFEHAAGTMISACSNAADVRRSCLWSNAEHGAYFDRAGVFWHLTVTKHTARRVAEAFDGSTTFVGRARGREQALELAIVFHVGTRVASFPAPDIWGSGEFGDY